MFSFLHRIHIDSGAYPPSYALDTGSFSSRAKRTGHEADLSPLSCVEVNAWSYTSSPKFSWCST